MVWGQHLGLELQGGIVQLELAQRIAQVLILVGIDREQAAEHHRLCHLVPV